MSPVAIKELEMKIIKMSKCFVKLVCKEGYHNLLSGVKIGGGCAIPTIRQEEVALFKCQFLEIYLKMSCILFVSTTVVKGHVNFLPQIGHRISWGISRKVYLSVLKLIYFLLFGGLYPNRPS